MSTKFLNEREKKNFREVIKFGKRRDTSVPCRTVDVKKQQQGRLGGTAVKRLPLAQGVILAVWDRAPHQALHYEPASSSPTPPASSSPTPPACVPSLAGSVT